VTLGRWSLCSRADHSAGVSFWQAQRNPIMHEEEEEKVEEPLLAVDICPIV
jgi:hypothetical protein